MHCKACDTLLPVEPNYRTILIPNPLDENTQITKQVEDDFCEQCASLCDSQ